MPKSTPRDLDVTALEDLALAQQGARGNGEHSDAMAVVFRILRLSQWMSQDFEAEVHRPTGSSSAGFTILFALNVAGPLEPRDLARVIGVTRASVSSALNTLERDGLIERRRESDDRRVVTVVLTRAGQAAVESMSERQHERERAWVEVLSAKERHELAQLLDRMLHSHPGRRSD